jgi:hypothetical protein
MPDVLTMNTSVMCVHGAKGTAIPSQTKVMVDNGIVLVASDTHIVAGCPFMKGIVPSPCILIQWANPSQKMKANQQPVLTKSSIGKCISGLDGSTQGIATISGSAKAKPL